MEVMRLQDAGIEPLNELLCKSRDCILLQLPYELGRVPVSLLPGPATLRYVNFVRELHELGRLPMISLSARFKEMRLGGR